MFVFDISSHDRVVPLWYAARSCASDAMSKPATRTPDARAYRVADAFTELVRLGVLRSGDKLPAERQLAATLGISRDAVRIALDLLQQRRMVKKRHGARSELWNAQVEPAPPLVLADACRALQASIDAAACAPLEGGGPPALVDDLIRLAAARAHDAADAEAIEVCRCMAAARGIEPSWSSGVQDGAGAIPGAS